MRSKVVDALRLCLNHVYCNTCEYDSDENVCENCHRKNMRWALSKEAAKELADIVISIMEEEKNE